MSGDFTILCLYMTPHDGDNDGDGNLGICNDDDDDGRCH